MKRRGRRYWLNLLGFTLGLWALLLAGGTLWFTYARTMAYIHPARQAATGQWLRQAGVQYEEVTLSTEDGLRLRAWYTAPRNGAVILVAHGHGASIPEEYYILFAQHGYGVLAWDFRAHGESEGDRSTLGYNEAMDIKAALDFALAQPGVRHVGAWGNSMGAAAIIHAAAKYPEIEAVVADSAYATLREVMEMRVPSPMLRPLVRLIGLMNTRVDLEWMRPEEDIGRISPRAVFIIQGLADAAIPTDSAERLYRAAGEPRFLWVEEGVGHVGMYLNFRESYTERVIDFLDEALLGAPFQTYQNRTTD